MAENYWNSSLTGENIENVLLNAVRGDAAQNKSDAWKEKARQNIGALGESSIDESLATAGKSADAKVAGLALKSVENSSNVALAVVGYDNDLLTWEQGGIHAGNGTNLSSTTVIRTVGFFDVTDVYDFVVEIPQGYRFRVYKYDDNGVLKNASDNYTDTRTLINTRSSSGTKCRFIFADNSDSPRDIYPQEGALFSLRSYQSSNSLLKLASPSTQYLDATVPLQTVHGVVKFPGNLFEPTNALNDYYIKWDTGERRSLSGYYATGYIPVVGGTTYRANFGRNLSWYDSSYAFISGVQGTSIKTSGVTAPANAAYIRFSIDKTADTSDLLDVYFASLADFDNSVTIPHLVAQNKPWCFGKKINWIGDSIVASEDFDEYVCNALGLIETDYGINGSTIAFPGSSSTPDPEEPEPYEPLPEADDPRNAICYRYKGMTTDADIIAVSCGTNDFEYAWSEVGTIESTSKRTFYGALKALCEGLLEMYPGKLIFFTTPIKRMQPFVDGDGAPYTLDFLPTTPFSKNKHGKTLGDYADIIKEVCALYSIPVLDMYRESMLNPYLDSGHQFFTEETDRTHGTTFTFYTHPNTAGRKIMARRVAGWLTQLGYEIS